LSFCAGTVNGGRGSKAPARAERPPRVIPMARMIVKAFEEFDMPHAHECLDLA